MSSVEAKEIEKNVAYIEAGKHENEYTLVSLHVPNGQAFTRSIFNTMASNVSMDSIVHGKYCIITNKGNTLFDLRKYLKNGPWSSVWVGSMYCINDKMNENINKYGNVQASLLVSGIEWFKYWIYDVDEECYEVKVNYSPKCGWFTNDYILSYKKVESELEAKCEVIKGLLRLKIIESYSPPEE